MRYNSTGGLAFFPKEEMGTRVVKYNTTTQKIKKNSSSTFFVLRVEKEKNLVASPFPVEWLVNYNHLDRFFSFVDYVSLIRR